MRHENGTGSRKTLVWGLFLIALGGVFLLGRLGLVEVRWVGELWPAVFFAIAANHFMDRRPGSGVMFTLMGVWFFACTFGWLGLTYRNSWGLLLVAVGLGIVIRAISGEEPRRRIWREREARHE